jgi:DNA-binding HxlR family transcriptional regulator
MGTDSETYTFDWRSVCSITSGLDVLGDKWSLLIVRDLISYGTRTYSEFRQSPEHVSTNILADRLRVLTSLGIIERTNPDGAARNNAYRLTASGEALRPVLEAIGRWSQTYLRQFHPSMVDSVS